jgi:hypothetical protein
MARSCFEPHPDGTGMGGRSLGSQPRRQTGQGIRETTQPDPRHYEPPQRRSPDPPSGHSGRLFGFSRPAANKHVLPPVAALPPVTTHPEWTTADSTIATTACTDAFDPTGSSGSIQSEAPATPNARPSQATTRRFG